MRRLIAFLALAATLAACSDDGPAAPAHTIAGNWSGGDISSTLALALTVNGQHVTGNGLLEMPGSLTVPEAGLPLSVSGSFTTPTFNLLLTSQGWQDIVFRGDVKGNRMSGTLTGIVFNVISITLTRQ